MNYFRLGSSGLKITALTYGSALTIGTERHDYKYAEELIDTAWQLGIRSFDTSNNYGYGSAEILLGQVLKKYPRQEYVLSTKGSWPIGESQYEKGLSRKHILYAFEQSFERLNIEYIDIYYAHRFDSEVSIEEIVRTFNYLIDSGRVRYWATSEWPLNAIKECHRVCDRLNMEKPIVEQFIYSYAIQKAFSNGVATYCQENGVGTMGFSPLCQGYLTGKYRNGIPLDSRIAKSDQLAYNKTVNFYEQNKSRIDFFLEVCDKYGVDYLAAALQWCLRKNIFPVLGASKKEQLISNVEAINKILPNSLWNELEKVPS